MTTTIEATRLTKPFEHDLVALPVLAGVTRRAGGWIRLCPAGNAAELTR